jgi:CBS domain-containing protein
MLDDVVEKYTRKSLFYIDENDFVSEAAKTMKEKDVESLIVLKNEILIGIITIKDILFRVVAKGLDPTKTKVSMVMSSPIVTIRVEDKVRDAVEIMAKITSVDS